MPAVDNPSNGSTNTVIESIPDKFRMEFAEGVMDFDCVAWMMAIENLSESHSTEGLIDEIRNRLQAHAKHHGVDPRVITITKAWQFILVARAAFEALKKSVSKSLESNFGSDVACEIFPNGNSTAMSKRSDSTPPSGRLPTEEQSPSQPAPT